MAREDLPIVQFQGIFEGLCIKRIAKYGSEREVGFLADACLRNYSWERYCYLVQGATRLVNQKREKEALEKGEAEFLQIISVEFPHRVIMTDCDIDQFVSQNKQ